MSSTTAKCATSRKPTTSTIARAVSQCLDSRTHAVDLSSNDANWCACPAAPPPGTARRPRLATEAAKAPRERGDERGGPMDPNHRSGSCARARRRCSPASRPPARPRGGAGSPRPRARPGRRAGRHPAVASRLPHPVRELLEWASYSSASTHTSTMSGAAHGSSRRFFIAAMPSVILSSSFLGITSQRVFRTSSNRVRWCCSPMTSDSSGSSGDCGQGGSSPRPKTSRDVRLEPHPLHRDSHPSCRSPPLPPPRGRTARAAGRATATPPPCFTAAGCRRPGRAARRTPAP